MAEPASPTCASAGVWKDRPLQVTGGGTEPAHAQQIPGSRQSVQLRLQRHLENGPRAEQVRGEELRTRNKAWV